MPMIPGRKTKERDGRQFVFPVKSGVEITPGTMVALDSSGEAVPAAAAAGLTVVGIAELFHGENDSLVQARRGCFAFDADAEGAQTNAGVGKPVYVADESTVSTTASNGLSSSALVNYPQAGILLAVDGDGCWVKI